MHQTQCALQRLLICHTQIKNYSTMQLLGKRRSALLMALMRLQWISYARMAKFILPHHPLTLAQGLSSNIGKVTQIAGLWNTGSWCKTAIGLQHQHHTSTHTQQ